ncbi:diacylglycerol/lipid kinase family protein [Lactobacillus helsingborgensis]|uniref:diacylglycerol/lipid kinase family protein n=1 Tax=Lactobacillus helsingborgensis TaxID=1218494 RepID=UPI0022648BB1|nr:YegS/Rv2252/BmrU family lipid kinase [Lactobacillus helsingborgensis]UZX32255.1 YegS/Rv2252/BmrU family lipid kinase [Lactobacillus helsingborgensis]
MNNKLKIHLLVNETAGNGHAKSVFEQTTALLINDNINFDTRKSDYAGEAIRIAQDYGNRPHSSNEILLVIGGDGSLNEVLNGIKRSSNPVTPIAYLPAGTGNDFGRAASLTADPKILLDRLKGGVKPDQIDCGSFVFPDINEDKKYYFANSFGVGFDAFVNHNSNISKLKKLLNRFNEGKLIYGYNVLASVTRQDTFSVDIETNKRKVHFDDAFLVTTTNHPYLGGGLPLLPSAKIDSHRIDTVVVEKFGLRKLVKLFINLLKDGSHVYDPQFHYFEAKKITVKTRQKEYAQVDGEEIKRNTFNVEFSVSSFNLLR